MNDISATIFYDTRIIISAPIDEPVTWKCSKVEQVSPKGISHLTFAQDKFNAHTDFIEKDEEGNVVGMWADYFGNGEIIPTELEQPSSKIYSVISCSGLKPDIKAGGQYKKFTVTFYEDDEVIAHRMGTWTFTIDGTDVSHKITTLDATSSTDVADNQIKAKLEADNSLIGKILVVGYEDSDGIKSEIEVNIVGF